LGEGENTEKRLELGSSIGIKRHCEKASGRGEEEGKKRINLPGKNLNRGGGPRKIDINSEEREGRTPFLEEL